jgi:molybdopterin-containing oxidoreductase family membrane subunit
VNGNGHSSAHAGDEILLQPLVKTGRGYRLMVLFLLGLIGWGAYAYYIQVTQGLGVTGLNRPVYWGIYITNFVFFIGISHAGTLISAILRVTKAEWRRPITRAAEAITVFALCIGAPQVLIDLGRIDRVPNMMLNAQFQSPLLWDVCCITTYLLGSIFYLYLPMIPDMAFCRDRLPSSMRVRKVFYSVLAMGWRGSEKQKHALERSIGFMAIVIIPVAVTVHTVVSFIFSMTIQPMWHSAILGPYFVVGAIFTGIASLLIAMAILRKVYHLEEYIKPSHFENLAKLLIAMMLLWAYFTMSEYLTTFYGDEPAHMSVFYTKFTGDYAPIFWTMVVCCFVIPMAILSFHRFRTVTGCVIASISINIGMWIERYTIVVPTLTNPRLPYQVQLYHPTWIEIAITVASFALMILLYAIFVKIFPIVSIWEIQEGRKLEGVEHAPVTTEAGQQQLIRGAGTDEMEVEETLHQAPSTRGRRAAREVGEFYFKTHILVIMGSVAVYLTVIGWMLWCFVKGGGYEFAVVPVVSCVLLVIILAATRSMVIIAWEGRPSADKPGLIRAQSKTVSVEQWAIRTADGPRKLL